LFCGAGLFVAVCDWVTELVEVSLSLPGFYWQRAAGADREAVSKLFCLIETAFK
jgi:hypothetical protein